MTLVWSSQNTTIIYSQHHQLSSLLLPNFVSNTTIFTVVARMVTVTFVNKRKWYTTSSISCKCHSLWQILFALYHTQCVMKLMKLHNTKVSARITLTSKTSFRLNPLCLQTFYLWKGLYDAKKNIYTSVTFKSKNNLFCRKST